MNEWAVVNNRELDCTKYRDTPLPIAADNVIQAVRKDDTRTGVYSKLRLQWTEKLDNEILSLFYQWFS
jgi:hypothetical protein